MSSLIEKLTHLKELQKNMNNSYAEYKSQKEMLKRKERECKTAKETYLKEFVLYFKENPITIGEFIKGLENVIYEEDLFVEITTLRNGTEWSEIKLKDIEQLDYTQYQLDKNGNLIWLHNDENSINQRKTYFLNLLNKTGKFIINVKIFKDNKIVANFTTAFETNSLDNNNFELLFISGENKSIKVNLKLNEIENLYFVIPEKYLTTRTQIGGGIKPEMIIEMLESIVNERLHTK